MDIKRTESFTDNPERGSGGTIFGNGSLPTVFGVDTGPVPTGFAPPPQEQITFPEDVTNRLTFSSAFAPETPRPEPIIPPAPIPDETGGGRGQIPLGNVFTPPPAGNNNNNNGAGGGGTNNNTGGGTTPGGTGGAGSDPLTGGDITIDSPTGGPGTGSGGNGNIIDDNNGSPGNVQIPGAGDVLDQITGGIDPAKDPDAYDNYEDFLNDVNDEVTAQGNVNNYPDHILRAAGLDPDNLPQGAPPPTKDGILAGIKDGSIDPLSIPEDQYNELGISSQDVNRALVDEDAIKESVTGVLQQQVGGQPLGQKALQVVDDFFQWILDVLDPTNIPGIGVKTTPSGNIEFGVLNVPGLIFGTLNPATGVISTSSGSTNIFGGQGGSGTGSGGTGGNSGDPDDNTGTGGDNQQTPGTGQDNTGDDDDNTTGAGDTDTPTTGAGDDDDDDDTTGAGAGGNSGNGDGDNSGSGGGGSGSGSGGSSGGGNGLPDTSDIVEQIIGGASAAASAAINISGIDDAAEAQLTGVREGLALQERIFEETQDRQDPFIQAGIDSIPGLRDRAEGSPDTGAQDVVGAQPTATGGVQPQTTAGQQAVDIINSANTLSNLRDVREFSAETGGDLPETSQPGDVDVPQETVDPVTRALDVVQGVDPFDVDSPTQQRLIDEAVRKVADFQAAGGRLGADDTRDAIATAVSDAFIQGAQQIEAVNTSQAQRQLQAEQQEFSQVIASDDSNFTQSLALRQQLGAEDRTRFDQEALINGIRFEQGRAVFDADLQQRSQEFNEQIVSGNLTFEQQMEFRNQLSDEDAQLFDMLMARDDQTFAQGQQLFTNTFNIDAQNFQQALDLDNSQFLKLLNIFNTGASTSVGAGNTAANFAGSQSDLLAAEGAVDASRSIGRANATQQAIADLIGVFT